MENKALDQKEIWTLEELCQYTGFAKSKIYKLTSGRLIPHSKPTGGTIFFESRKIKDWLMSAPVKTIEQLNTEASTYITTSKLGKYLPLERKKRRKK